MRYSFAAVFALASLAVAAPHYGYEESEPSSTVASYPVSTPEGYYGVPSSSAAGYPVPSSKPSYEAPSSAPGYPVPAPSSSAPCVSSTVTVTLPYPSGTGYPGYPVGPKPSSKVPYPIPSSKAPYPVPSGTGYPVPPKPSGTASSTGSYVKPSSPAQFTGAASHAQIGGFVAGVGAFAALFL